MLIFKIHDLNHKLNGNPIKDKPKKKSKNLIHKILY